MTSVGESFSWPFADREWVSKFVIQGLIALIPIIGSIALLGWVLMTVDNFRAGRRELAPAGFHLERGVALWVVIFVYALVLSLPGSFISGAGASSDNGAGAAFLGGLLDLACFGLLLFLLPAVSLNTYRGGFSGGFDVATVWHLATGEASPTILAAVLLVVAALIAPLGFFACCVGLLFTLPYAGALMAGTLTWYERALTGTPAAS